MKRPATTIKEIRTDSENEWYGNTWVSKLVLKGQVTHKLSLTHYHLIFFH